MLYAGKPYRPIYDMALARAEQARGAKTPLSRVLAIGDSVRTDLKGAAAFGIDCLFVTAGIHAEELGGRDDPDLQLLAGIFADGRRSGACGDPHAGLVRSRFAASSVRQRR